MSYVLRTDEILEGLINANHPRATEFRQMLETLASDMASALADILEIQAGPATFEGVAFAGTAAVFRPAFPGQPCPDAIEQYDTATEWSED